MNITQWVFPSCTSTLQSQLTSCWSALRHIRKMSLVQSMTNKQQSCKALHTDTRWNYRSSHCYRKGTLTSTSCQAARFHSNIPAMPMRKSPSSIPCSTTISTRWYVRDRDSTNKSHANKILKDVMPLTTRRVVRLKKNKESTSDAKVKWAKVQWCFCKKFTYFRA